MKRLVGLFLLCFGFQSAHCSAMPDELWFLKQENLLNMNVKISYTMDFDESGVYEFLMRTREELKKDLSKDLNIGDAPMQAPPPCQMGSGTEIFLNGEYAVKIFSKRANIKESTLREYTKRQRETLEGGKIFPSVLNHIVRDRLIVFGEGVVWEELFEGSGKGVAAVIGTSSDGDEKRIFVDCATAIFSAEGFGPKECRLVFKLKKMGGLYYPLEIKKIALRASGICDPSADWGENDPPLGLVKFEDYEEIGETGRFFPSKITAEFYMSVPLFACDSGLNAGQILTSQRVFKIYKIEEVRNFEEAQKIHLDEAIMRQIDEGKIKLIANP